MQSHVGYQTCSNGGGFNNFLSALPRLNAGLHGVSKNLAAYDWFRCPDNGTHCGLGELQFADVSRLAIDAVTARLGRSPESDSDARNYVQALALYFYVGLALALLSTLVLICTLTWICVRKTRGCFSRAVTWSRPASRRQSSKSVGAIPTLPKFDVAKQKRQRLWANLLLGFYVLATVCFIFAGVFNGALGMEPAAHRAFIRSPTKLAGIVQGLNPPLQTFLAASGATISNTLRQVNQSIVSTVDLDALRRSVECAQKGQLKLPSNGTLESVLSAVQSTYEQIPDSQTVGLQLETAQEEVANLSRVLPPVSTTLQVLVTMNIGPALSEVESHMSSLNRSMALLTNGPDELDSFSASVLEALSEAEVLVDGDGTGGLLGQLRGLPLKGCIHCPGGSQYRQQLLTSLREFRLALLNVTSFSAELDSIVDSLASLPDARALAASMRALDAALINLPRFSQLATNLTLLDGALASEGLSGLYVSMTQIVNAPDTVQYAVNILSALSGNLTQVNGAIDTYGPCVRNIREQLNVVNKTLVHLPHSLDFVRRRLHGIRTHPVILPDFAAIQASLQSFLLDVQFVLPTVAQYQGPFARAVNLTEQLTGNLSLANLTTTANALAHKRWSLELQAAQVDGAAPALARANASAVHLQEVLRRVADAKAPLLTALKIALSPSAADGAAVLAAGPQLIPAISAFRSAAGTTLAEPLPGFAALAAALGPLPGLEEHLQDLRAYRGNIAVLAAPDLSKLLVGLSGALQTLPNLADVSALWGQLSFQAPAAPLNLTSAIAAARRVGAQRLMSADNFTTAYQYLDRATDLLYASGDVIVTQLEPASLNASLAENGTGAAANGIFDAVNRIYSLATGETSSTDPLDSAVVRSGLDLVGRIGAFGTGSGGSVAYLAIVADVANGTTDTGRNDSAGMYFSFKGASCLTDACLSNSIDLLFEGSLSKAADVIFGTGAFSAWQLSLQGTLVIAYVVPSLAAALAALSIVFPRRWLAVTVAGLVLTTTPPMLLISGALEAPIGILAADVCGSFASETVKLLNTTAPTYHVSVANRSVSIDPTLLAASVLDGSCALANDVSDTWQNVSRAIVPYVPFLTSSWLGSQNAAEGYRAGKKLDAIVRNGSAAVSALLQDLLRSGQTTASCQTVHEAYVDIHVAFCCDLVNSVQWYFGSWYVIALLLLFVGTPASLLAAYSCPRWQALLTEPQIPEEVPEIPDVSEDSIRNEGELSGRPVRAPSLLEPQEEETDGSARIPADSPEALDPPESIPAHRKRQATAGAGEKGYVPWTATWASGRTSKPGGSAGSSRRSSSSLFELQDIDALNAAAAKPQPFSLSPERTDMKAPLVGRNLDSTSPAFVETPVDSTGLDLGESPSEEGVGEGQPAKKVHVPSRTQLWSALTRAGSWRHSPTQRQNP